MEILFSFFCILIFYICWRFVKNISNHDKNAIAKYLKTKYADYVVESIEYANPNMVNPPDAFIWDIWPRFYDIKIKNHNSSEYKKFLIRRTTTGKISEHEDILQDSINTKG